MANWDMHMHSDNSDDGTYAPARVMELCAEAGLDLVALADHDSVEGVAEAQKRGKELGITVIPAIEFNCVCKGLPLHLLGYNVRREDDRLQAVMEHVVQMGRDASAERMRLIRETGIFFDEEEVLAHSWRGVVTGELIGEFALLDDRNRSHPLMKELYEGGSRSDNPLLNFFWDICSPGKPGYVRLSYMAFEEAQELITYLDGISVIAHPGQTVKTDLDRIRYMKEQGVKGLEVYSSYHTPQQVSYYRDLAKELQLFATPGSDFHGKSKPSVHLGRFNVEPEPWMREAFLESIGEIKQEIR